MMSIENKLPENDPLAGATVSSATAGGSSAGTWSPDQYARFKSERSRPFYDLMGLVQRRPGMLVADLGCGTGELTADLHSGLAAKSTLAIDSSDAMLAKSAKFAAHGLSFVKQDIAGFQPAEKLDLIFSNAALQWLPDHEALLAKLAGCLRPGGQIAIQMPANDDYPSHVVARELAAESPFREALGGYTGRRDILPIEQYAMILDKLGFSELKARHEVYVHHLGSRADVVEWVKGALLTDYEGRMPKDLYEEFLARYTERLLPKLEDTTPFVYPFKRILLWGALPC